MAGLHVADPPTPDGRQTSIATASARSHPPWRAREPRRGHRGLAQRLRARDAPAGPAPRHGHRGPGLARQRPDHEHRLGTGRGVRRRLPTEGQRMSFQVQSDTLRTHATLWSGHADDVAAASTDHLRWRRQGRGLRVARRQNGVDGLLQHVDRRDGPGPDRCQEVLRLRRGRPDLDRQPLRRQRRHGGHRHGDARRDDLDGRPADLRGPDQRHPGRHGGLPRSAELPDPADRQDAQRRCQRHRWLHRRHLLRHRRQRDQAVERGDPPLDPEHLGHDRDQRVGRRRRFRRSSAEPHRLRRRLLVGQGPDLQGG